MGCYWKCDCDFKIESKSVADRIIQFIKETDDTGEFYWNNHLHLDVDVTNSNMNLAHYAHDSYSYGEYFETLMSAIAEKFGLDGEMYLQTDEDEGNPPQKTTFERGKTIHWNGEIIYTRVEN